MGPLTGIRVIELKGIGPLPYAGMLLADLGADVIVVDRANPSSIALPSDKDVHSRGKTQVVLDLKSAEDVAQLLALVEQADVLLEGFRPGVMERLGLSPDVCLQRNAKLVYGRMTGWGQTGPLAKAAGHDINYISISGALAAIGSDKPTPPLNLVGDYAGGSMFLIMGVLAALLESKQSGRGQVIDAAITDGVSSLMSMFNSLSALGVWSNRRHSNMFDGAAHYYNTYQTADDKWLSIGSIEPQFYALLIEKADLDIEQFKFQHDSSRWSDLTEQLAVVFKTKTRDEWCEIMEGTDICFAPVLDYTEAPKHKHNVARDTYIELNGMVQPAPAPRFSRTQCDRPKVSAEPITMAAVLERWRS